MLNVTKTMLLVLVATVGVCGTATAQKHSQHNHHSFGGGHQQHGSHHSSNSTGGYGHRDHHYHNNHHGYGHIAFRHPATYGYGNYHGYRGFNGHEVADIVRSRAQANLVNAQALTQAEVARSARMDNSVKALQTYIARRSINSELRFAHLRARGDYVRTVKAETKLVAHQAGIQVSDEPRLTTDEVNDVTGRLHWPLLLLTEHFDKARQPVNQVFATRAHVGEINPNHYLPLCDWISKVSHELTQNVENYPEADYAEAQDFLRRLVVEARLPAGSNTTMQFATK